MSKGSPNAQRIYEGLGFREWGRQPEAVQHAGSRWDEIFMTLRLTPKSRP